MNRKFFYINDTGNWQELDELVDGFQANSLTISNSQFLKSLDNSGENLIDLIGTDEGNNVLLPDNVQTKSNTAPVSDKALTNKKYVVDVANNIINYVDENIFILSVKKNGELITNESSTLNFMGSGVEIGTEGDTVNITIPGGGSSSNFETEYHTIILDDLAIKSFNLSNSPINPSKVIVDVMRGAPQQYSIDFTVSGNTFSWENLGLDGELGLDDVVRVCYFY